MDFNLTSEQIMMRDMVHDFARNEMTTLTVKGRHDTCIALRMPVIVEAATAVAMADLLLTDRGINGIRNQ